MRRLSMALLLAIVAQGLHLIAQSGSPLTPANQATIVAAAQKAVLRAVNFHQGDLAALNSARADFTAEGWKEFIKHMQGFLDEKGAPTFNSSFVPSKDAVVVGQENGVIHLRIPGTLKQTQNQSSTTYRAFLDVYAFRDLPGHAGKPIKIQRLEQVTCVGASTACQ